MLVSTFLVWIALFIVGHALIVWPRLDAYRTEPEIEVLTFVDALYYSGVTVTVLGHGDITPLTPGLKILTFVMSGLGFALLTGIITYLLNVLNGVTERNKLALRVWIETGSTGDGAHFAIRSLQGEEIADLRGRLDALVEALQNLQELLHHYPIIDLYYRAKDPALDPEPVIQTLVEMAVAGRLLARDERAHRLGPVAGDLGQSVTHVMAHIAERYLGQDTRRRIEHPEPGDEDRAYVAAVAARLARELGNGYALTTKGVDDATLALACRSRVFLEAVEPLTRWRADHGV